jgi:hypothetical protein
MPTAGTTVAVRQRAGERVSADRSGWSKPGLIEAQLLRRSVNEQVLGLTARFAGAAEVELLCECAKPGCRELVTIAPDGYEDVRRFPTRFLTRPGHSSNESERIVSEGPEHIVVEKLGADAQAAIRTDPRRTIGGANP